MDSNLIDPNIPETGDQLAKSNNGPDNCCYEYCDPFSVYKGTCSRCDTFEVDPTDSPAIASERQKQLQQQHQQQQQQKQLEQQQQQSVSTLLPSLSSSPSQTEQQNEQRQIDDSKALQLQYESSSVTKLEIPPQTCQLVPGLSLTTSRCEIPYYASSFDASSLHAATATSMPATVPSTLAETT